jgi:hypothetical protein
MIKLSTVNGARRLAIAGLTGVALVTGMFVAPGVARADTTTPSTSLSNSDYGAGYYTQPSNGFASTSATFTVPRLSCTASTDPAAFGVQADWTDFEGEGGSVYAVAVAQCNSSVATYQLVVGEPGGTEFTENGVSGGDTVIASIYQTSSVFEATVHDITSNYAWVADNSPVTTTGWTWSTWTGEFYWGGFNFPRYTTSTFTKCQVNGDYLAYVSGLTRYNFKVAPHYVKSSALYRSGDEFKLTWVS